MVEGTDQYCCPGKAKYYQKEKRKKGKGKGKGKGDRDRL